VMVHGFDSSRSRGEKDYREISERLRPESEKLGFNIGTVGIHWDSDAGDRAKWLLQATGSRVTSLLGLKKAVKNPYLEKCELAAQVGRSGLRSVFFRLQEEFPMVPVHVVAHSMGAQVVVSALAPQVAAKNEDQVPTVEPQRPVRLGMVTLAGADLDCDLFTRKENTVVRMALRRAKVWWFTVPDAGQADGILELRRGAGKCDAVGNRGLELTSEDLNHLLSRRALVMDQGNVPAGHGIKEYFNPRRIEALASSMLYLEEPQARAAQNSVLAALDRVLSTDRGTAARLASAGADHPTVRLYAAWKVNADLRNVPVVSVAHSTTEGRLIPAGMQANR